jgi:hypothetical protein
MLKSRMFDKHFTAEVDLSACQYKVVTRGTAAGQCKKCVTTDRPLGILQNAPGIGETALVRIAGFSPVVADGAFAYNDILAVLDTNGEVDTATALTGGTATSWAVGYAAEAAGGAGSLAECHIDIHRYCTG